MNDSRFPEWLSATSASVWCKSEAVTDASCHEPRVRTRLTVIFFKKNGKRARTLQVHGAGEHQDASCGQEPEDFHEIHDQWNNSVIGVPSQSSFCGMYSNPRPSGSS